MSGLRRDTDSAQRVRLGAGALPMLQRLDCQHLFHELIGAEGDGHARNDFVVLWKDACRQDATEAL